jgi:hypothetical protein
LLPIGPKLIAFGISLAYNAFCKTVFANCTILMNGSTPVLPKRFALGCRTPGGTVMSWRKVRWVKMALLSAAAFLGLVPQVMAGPRVVAGRATTPPKPAPVPVARAVRPAVTISVVVTAPAQPAKAPAYVDLRGPDGKVRRFPVEGGQAAIQTRQLVLRAGQSITLVWVAPK